jgi:asparagine synthase (glutamine-hydrolysing)
MYHSLEVRVPLLDREVLAISARVDWRSCLDLRSNIGKQPLRAALARRVRFQTAEKRFFTVSMAEWLRGPLRPIFEEVVLPRREILGLPIRQKAVRAQFQRHIDRKTDCKWGLWRLLSLCLWEQRHYRREASPTA